MIHKVFVILIFGLIALPHVGLTQVESESIPHSGGSWNAFLLMSLQYDNDRNDRRSDIGGGLQYDHRYNGDFGWAASLSYRNWQDLRISLLPLHVGPQYFLGLSPKTTSSLNLGIGPVAVLGNDFAGFGASAAANVDFHFTFSKDVNFLIGIGYGGAWLWHPSQFGYLDIRGGVRF